MRLYRGSWWHCTCKIGLVSRRQPQLKNAEACSPIDTHWLYPEEAGLKNIHRVAIGSHQWTHEYFSSSFSNEHGGKVSVGEYFNGSFTVIQLSGKLQDCYSQTPPLDGNPISLLIKCAVYATRPCDVPAGESRAKGSESLSETLTIEDDDVIRPTSLWTTWPNQCMTTAVRSDFSLWFRIDGTVFYYKNFK